MIEKIKSLFNSKAIESTQPLVKAMWDAGFSFIGSNLQWLGRDIRADLNTMYNISKTNKMAWAYIEKISNMVWRYGFELYDENWEKVDPTKDKKAAEVLQKCKKLFRAWYSDNKTFDIFCMQYFTHIFSSGEVSIVANALNGLFKAPEDGRVKVLDTRGITKKVDKYWDIQSYEYRTNLSYEKLLPDQIVNYVAYPDVDNPINWLSKFNRIYMEAISNFEANSRQMYFFRNNAMPNVIVMMDSEKMSWRNEDIAKKIHDFKDTRDQKYSGQSNQGKPLITSIVKDIKVLDSSNVDMDLIMLRKENDKDFAVVFLMDTRLIWINKENGSYGEVESTTIRQGNDQIDAYWEMMSETLNILYRKFIDPELPYTIKTKNAEFTNDYQERAIWLQEVASGTRTPNSYITEIRWWTASDDPAMDQYRTPINKQPQQ